MVAVFPSSAKPADEKGYEADSEDFNPFEDEDDEDYEEIKVEMESPSGEMNREENPRHSSSRPKPSFSQHLFNSAITESYF